MCQQESIKPRDSNNFSMSHLTYVEKNISEIQNAQGAVRADFGPY
jgi:hypothetical protein